jgi:hypothetical protein
MGLDVGYWSGEDVEAGEILKRGGENPEQIRTLP